MQAQEAGESDTEKYEWRRWRIWGTSQAFLFFMKVKIIESYCYWDEMTFLPQSMKKKRNAERNSSMMNS